MEAMDWQTEQFEQCRSHLHAVAYRMLGSAAEADDAVQEAWLRLNRADRGAVENMRAWLTTVVSRICLDMLRTRRARREELTDDWLSITLEADESPEGEALLADSVGLALLVVLDMLSPPERLAFVLHDMFGVPFEEIAPIVERSVDATRQLASRARRRVRGAREPKAESVAEQRRVVEAFLKAAREGDFEALLEVLDPDIVFRADSGQTGPPAPPFVHGASEVANVVLERGTRFARFGRPAIVNGTAGAVVATPDRVIPVVKFAIANGRVTEMDLVLDPVKLANVRP